MFFLTRTSNHPVESILSVHQISKSYGRVHALSNVSFEVPPGSVFGVLGPNGSGKTTLLGIILNVLQANTGSYAWFGDMQREQARRQIGSLLETPNFYHYLSALDNLEIVAKIKRCSIADREAALQTLGLYERRNSLFHTFSLGMKQRLALAATLLGSPKVLVLDEPTNGLDPAGIAEIRQLIRELNAKGYTIIMASHMLDEVEKVCTHVAILKKGNLLLSGKVDEVLRSEDQLEVAAADLNFLHHLLKEMQGIRSIQRYHSVLLLSCSEGIEPHHVNEYCMQHGVVLSHLMLKKKSLETKFMELTN